MEDRKKSRIKVYNLTPQERDNYCVCSVLQAILRSHGISISQVEIADRLTPAENGFLTNDNKIKEFLKSKGFEYKEYYHDTTQFNEPDMLLQDMQENDGIIGIDKHTYLLVYFRDPNIEMIDPKDAAIKTRTIYEVLKEMRRCEGEFGLIKRIK